MGEVVMKNTTTNYGLAANGTDVGSGYDVEIRRTGRTSAIVCKTKLATKDEWMLELEDVEPEEDLQAIAISYGSCPSRGCDEYWIPDTDWDADLLQRWNSAGPGTEDAQQD